MNTEIADEIRTLVAPSLSHLGVDLVDTQVSRGKHGLVRLVIDKPGGVSVGDCERVSAAVSTVLDTYDPMSGKYSLEVTSPGAERPIRTRDDWLSALGHRINVRYRAGGGEAVVEGRLLAVADDHAELEVRVSRNRQAGIEVPLIDVVAARIAVDI